MLEEGGVLDLHRLRLLRELKHRGTLAAVAEALAYTPSAISQQLSVLETEAGVPLLERAGRRVRLTPAAERLVEHTEAILERLEQARADLDASAASISGTVRIAWRSSRNTPATRSAAAPNSTTATWPPTRCAWPSPPAPRPAPSPSWEATPGSWSPPVPPPATGPPRSAVPLASSPTSATRAPTSSCTCA